MSSSGIGNNSVVCLIAKRLWEGLRFDDESWPLCTLPRFRFRLTFFFAMLSPLIGLIFGFLGAWFFSGADSVT